MKKALITVANGFLRLVFVLAISLLLALAWLWPRNPYAEAVPFEYRIERYSANPVIHTEMNSRLLAIAQAESGININGPSVIRVPDWVANPLGKYYLYFAHHKGDFIRMAYADSIEGPWKIHESGTLTLTKSGFPTEKVPVLTGKQGFFELWKDFQSTSSETRLDWYIRHR